MFPSSLRVLWGSAHISKSWGIVLKKTIQMLQTQPPEKKTHGREEEQGVLTEFLEHISPLASWVPEVPTSL